MSNRNHRPISGRVKFAWAMLIFALSILAQAKPFLSAPDQQPQHPKQEDRLRLVHADNLYYDQFEHPGAQRLSGHVEFEHDGMRLKCDSAVYFQISNSFEAFGHVHMTQGDTLSLIGKRLYYRGDDQMAEVRDSVVMTHRQQTLYTDSLNYDRLYGLAYFFDGGKLVDGNTVLTSDWGEYHTDTRLSVFNYNVELSSPQFRLLSDTLHYDMDTKWAHVFGPSNIYSDGSRIYTELGDYNTESEETKLYSRSSVYNNGASMVGDSIFYNKLTGEMRAYRDVIYKDSLNNYELQGDYCEYNELTGRGMAYDKALAKDYSNGRDTLYVHADTLKLYTFNIETDSVYRVMHGFYHARAYRTDVQAVADSLVFNSSERKLSLYKDPIVWSENRQIVGEEIHAYANDSTIDSVYVREQALLVEQLDSLHFNQVAGQLMRSYFERGVMKLNCVDGNVYVVNFPLERDSAIVYQNATETAKLRMYMQDGKMKRLWAPGSKGTLYVAGLAPAERTRLSNFAWFDYIRPLNKDDLFEWRPKKKGTELRPSVRHVAPVQTLTSPKKATVKQPEVPEKTESGEAAGNAEQEQSATTRDGEAVTESSENTDIQ